MTVDGPEPLGRAGGKNGQGVALGDEIGDGREAGGRGQDASLAHIGQHVAQAVAITGADNRDDVGPAQKLVEAEGLEVGGVVGARDPEVVFGKKAM